jgi:hypothetical protein
LVQSPRSIQNNINAVLVDSLIINKAAEGKPKPRGDWWLGHRQRRTYRGVDFAPPPYEPDPGCFQLWEGTYLKPKANTQLTRFMDFVWEIICDMDTEVYDYVVKWMAHLVQKPGERAEVAIVLCGGKGTGKGTFGTTLMHLFRQHAMSVSSAEHFTGRFNDHLEGLVYLFVDEAFWAGDHRSEGRLKSLITEANITYEGKNQHLNVGRNCLSVCIASNEQYVVPAGMDNERRYCVLNISEDRTGQKPYFKAIKDELEADGYEALFAYLQSIDLADWHPRDDIPQTEGLQEQKFQNLHPIESWWLELLLAGEINHARTPWENGSTIIPMQFLHEEFQAYHKNGHYKTFRAAQISLGQTLKKLIPGYKAFQTQRLDHELIKPDAHNRIRVASLPSLEICRKSFEKRFGSVDWSEFNM